MPKATGADASLSDFDRPLNERGKSDAPLMVHRLIDKNIFIDAFISSPAKQGQKNSPDICKRIQKR